MANKRDFKKAIRYACGDIAGECIFAEQTFEGVEPEKWDQIILNVALLQEEAVNRVGAKFDKAPKDFANKKEYKKARRTFYKGVEKEISEYMHTEIGKVAADMNSLMPTGIKK